ncbi:MAG: hypothetical protein JO142_13185 [Burkholderiales bacterium]|nr:hypothetical protein [Burkholderiales bacterium]
MKRVLLSALLTLCAATSAHAAGQAAPVTTAGSYVDMCKQATNLPAQHGGESDLKGNPKLDEYCGCFSEKFTARALKTNPNSPPPPREQTRKEEFAMRASCRNQLGLPPPPATK